MGSTTNVHGLSRGIPEPVARDVRQRCGFGCVICGCGIIQYHHFDPPFGEAHRHDSHGITLLCGRCHDKVTRGLIGANSVRQADAAPFCRQAGVTRDMLFLGARATTVRLGCALFSAEAIIQVDDTILFGFSKPQVDSPLLLNANLPRENGGTLLRIVNNEWQVGVDNFDVYTKGPRLVVQEKEGELALELRYPGDGLLELSRLTMRIRGARVECRPDAFEVTNRNGGRVCLRPQAGATSSNVVGDIGLHFTANVCLIAASKTGGGAAVCLAL